MDLTIRDVGCGKFVIVGKLGGGHGEKFRQMFVEVFARGRQP